MSPKIEKKMLSFEDIHLMAERARRRAESAKKAKRAFRPYLELANALDQLAEEHEILVNLARGLVAELSAREHIERRKEVIENVG